jgi:hypothetical protein
MPSFGSNGVYGVHFYETTEFNDELEKLRRMAYVE